MSWSSFLLRVVGYLSSVMMVGGIVNHNNGQIVCSTIIMFYAAYMLETDRG